MSSSVLSFTKLSLLQLSLLSIHSLHDCCPTTVSRPLPHSAGSSRPQAAMFFTLFNPSRHSYLYILTFTIYNLKYL